MKEKKSVTVEIAKEVFDLVRKTAHQGTPSSLLVFLSSLERPLFIHPYGEIRGGRRVKNARICNSRTMKAKSYTDTSNGTGTDGSFGIHTDIYIYIIFFCCLKVLSLVSLHPPSTLLSLCGEAVCIDALLCLACRVDISRAAAVAPADGTRHETAVLPLRRWHTAHTGRHRIAFFFSGAR